MNEDRTSEACGTKLAQADSLDVPTLRKSLDALRAKHGADTPIGHRCSNLIEQLKNLDGATGGQRALLQRQIDDSSRALFHLTKDPRPAEDIIREQRDGWER